MIENPRPNLRFLFCFSSLSFFIFSLSACFVVTFDVWQRCNLLFYAAFYCCLFHREALKQVFQCVRQSAMTKEKQESPVKVIPVFYNLKKYIS